MAITTRKNATRLTVMERDKFLEALVRLKNKTVPGKAYSVYDQFVALHGAVMGINVPGESDPVNMGHQNIGFLPWHREYLWRFERALQAEVPGVTIPYWHWPDSRNATKLFIDHFIGPSRLASSSADIISGYFSGAVPSPRPAWWPSVAFTWKILPSMEGDFGMILQRGSRVDDWPPTTAEITALEKSNVRTGGFNPYWNFWATLEANPRKHNTGHVAIGGHMVTEFSPNDPLFWMHHAYIDRVWARWQANQLAAEPGSTFSMHYPAQTEAMPFAAGEVPPNGHRINDMMWPWIGTTQGYSVISSFPAPVRAMLIDYSGESPRRVRDVLDIRNMTATDGYTYS